MNPCSSTFQADLHNHSTFSDGELSPGDLVRTAQKLNLKAIAVTDHDTIDGLESALDAASNIDIEVICGAEITVRFLEPFFRGSLHLLIYFHKNLLDNYRFCEETAKTLDKSRGPDLTSSRIAAINDIFGPDGQKKLLPRKLLETDVYRHGKRISRRHFALALNDLGIPNKATISSIIGNDSPAYIPSGVPMNDLHDYLSSWPLIKIFAHPAAGSFPGQSHYKEVLPPFETVQKLLPRFLEIGLDGFEICYPGHTKQLMERLESIRLQHNLPLFTGGSDCHDHKNRPMGVCGVSMDVVRQINDLLDERMA